MKRSLSAVAVLLFLSQHSAAQEMRFAGTHPPDTAVLRLIRQYEKAAYGIKTIAEREAGRKSFISAGYFYHGMDGAPVSADSLLKRQANNNFQKLSDSLFRFTLFQYENTAVLSFRSHEKGLDKGRPYEGTGSWLLLMGKEAGRWKVIADVIGQDPPQR